MHDVSYSKKGFESEGIDFSGEVVFPTFFKIHLCFDMG